MMGMTGPKKSMEITERIIPNFLNFPGKIGLILPEVPWKFPTRGFPIETSCNARLHTIHDPPILMNVDVLNKRLAVTIDFDWPTPEVADTLRGITGGAVMLGGREELNFGVLPSRSSRGTIPRKTCQGVVLIVIFQFFLSWVSVLIRQRACGIPIRYVGVITRKYVTECRHDAEEFRCKLST